MNEQGESGRVGKWPPGDVAGQENRASNAASEASTRSAYSQAYRSPEVGGNRGARLLLKGGTVLTLDEKVGDFEQADVLVEGKKIVAIAPHLEAADAQVIDCSGTIVMPGFISTHQHQYQTLMRSALSDGIHIRAIPANSQQPVAKWP
ncbi:MAG: amidohydrolase family protein, partial [Solimonas sp.]